MMRTNGWSKSISGDRLWGDQPLRYIFIDEAGTSEKEPVRVVVGLIASADEHVMSAEALVHEILGGVPPQHRHDFVWHATSVFGDKKYQDGGWMFSDRLQMLVDMMSVPARIGMAITVSVVWRNAVDHSQGMMKYIPVKQHQAEHFIAFSHCLSVADRNIRRYAGPREVATVVAEDVVEMRKYLKHLPRMIRMSPDLQYVNQLRQVETDREAGHSTQNGDMRILRIRNSVHFVDKAEDPLIQVADACAYGFRRFFAGEKFGPEFATAILGDPAKLRNFAPPGGTECYWPTATINRPGLDPSPQGF